MRSSSAAREAPRQHAVDDHGVEVATELVAQPVLQLERLGDRHLGRQRDARRSRCAPGPRAARAPVACPAIGPTRAIAPNVRGESSMPSAWPVAARRARRGRSRARAPALGLRELPDLDHADQLLRARCGRREVLEGGCSRRAPCPDTRPPSACSHSSSARSGSIEMLDRPLASSVSAPGSRAGRPNSSGSRACSPTSTTIVRRPRSAASSAERGRERRLADAALARHDEQLCVSAAADIASGQSVLERARAGATMRGADLQSCG